MKGKRMPVPESRAEVEAKLRELGHVPEDWDTPADWERFVDFMALLGWGLNEARERWEELPHDVWEEE